MMKMIRDNSGQSMLFMVMSLSAIIVMVASLSSLIMTFELRQTTDQRATGQAIMAADTGVECAIYDEFYGGTLPAVCGSCGIGDERKCTGRNFPGENPPTFIFDRKKPAIGNQGQKIITWVAAGKDYQSRAARALQIKFVEQR